MHHWLLVLFTGFDKMHIARVYRFRTIKEIANVLDSTTTIVSNTVHKLILPRHNLKLCEIRKVDDCQIKLCADLPLGLLRPLSRLH
jgi:hypothetical protein